jgi:microcystin degradation protein MlrC
MLFRVGGRIPGAGIDIVAVTNNGQTNDLGQFTSLGVDPARYHTATVKSAHHFRAAVEPIARQVVLVDTGALCANTYSPDLFKKGPPPGLASTRSVDRLRRRRPRRFAEMAAGRH